MIDEILMVIVRCSVFNCDEIQRAYQRLESIDKLLVVLNLSCVTNVSLDCAVDMMLITLRPSIKLTIWQRIRRFFKKICKIKVW